MFLKLEEQLEPYLMPNSTEMLVLASTVLHGGTIVGTFCTTVEGVVAVRVQVHKREGHDRRALLWQPIGT